MLVERTAPGVITVHSDGQVSVREDTIIERDGIEVARTFHRRVLQPGDNIAAETDAKLKAILAIVWTKDVIDAFKIKVAASENRRPL